MKLFKKISFIKTNVLSLLFLFGFSTILTSCQDWTVTSKNFNTGQAPLNILGESSLTSLENTEGSSPKYDLDGDDNKKEGVWEFEDKAGDYPIFFDKSTRRISWGKLHASPYEGLPYNYRLELKWTPAVGDGTGTITKEITLAVYPQTTNSSVPDGTELTSSANIEWDGFNYKNEETYNFNPNFLIAPGSYDSTDYLTLNNYTIGSVMPSFTFLILSDNPKLMRLSDNGGKYYHQTIYLGSLDDTFLGYVNTLEFEIIPVPGTDVKDWYHIYSKTSGYSETKTSIFENGEWVSEYTGHDVTKTILELDSVFKPNTNNKIRDITTVGTCDSSFDKNNPVPSNNLFSFLRPFNTARTTGHTLTSKLSVNGKPITSDDTNYKVLDYKFGIKKSSIVVGQKYNFLFVVEYDGKTFYKQFSMEGSLATEIAHYTNNTNYYVDVDDHLDNKITIEPTKNTDTKFPKDVLFDIQPANSQALSENSKFSLVYKQTDDGSAYSELSWTSLENTTANNKIWIFEIRVKIPFSGILFKIWINFFKSPINAVASGTLEDGKTTDGTQIITINGNSAAKVANQSFTVKTSLPGIKFFSAASGGTENKTDNYGKIYLRGKTEIGNKDGQRKFAINIIINNISLNTTYTVTPGTYFSLPVNEKFYKMSDIYKDGTEAKQIGGWSDEFVTALGGTNSEIENYIKENADGTLDEYEIGSYLTVNLSGKDIAWNANFTNAIVWSKLNIYKLDLSNTNWIVWSATDWKLYSGYYSFLNVTSDTLREIDLGNACFYGVVTGFQNGKIKITSGGNNWQPFWNFDWVNTGFAEKEIRGIDIQQYTAFHTFEGCKFKNLEKLNLENTDFFLKSLTNNNAVSVILNIKGTAQYIYLNGCQFHAYSAYNTFLQATFGSQQTHTTLNLKNLNLFTTSKVTGEDKSKVLFNVNASGASFPCDEIKDFAFNIGSDMFKKAVIYTDNLKFDDVNFTSEIEVANITESNKLPGLLKSGVVSCSHMFDSAEIHAPKIEFKDCKFFHSYTDVKEQFTSSPKISVLNSAFTGAQINDVSEISIDDTNSFTRNDEKINFYGNLPMDLFSDAFAATQSTGLTTINLGCKLNLNLQNAGTKTTSTRKLDVFSGIFRNSSVTLPCNINVGYGSGDNDNTDNITLSSNSYIYIYNNAFNGFSGSENHIKLAGTWNETFTKLVNTGNNYNFSIKTARTIDISQMCFAKSTYANVRTYKGLFVDTNEQTSKTGIYVYLPTTNTTPEQDFAKFKLDNCFGAPKTASYAFIGYSQKPNFLPDSLPQNSKYYLYSHD